MTQHEEPEPSSQRPQNASENEPQTPERQNLRPEVATTCLSIVDEFRKGATTKVRAILALQAAIPREGLTEDSYISAFGSYQRMLDNVEDIQNAAFERQRQQGAQHDSGSNNSAPEQTTDRTAKRPRATNDDDDSAEEGENTTRRKIDAKVFPWKVRDEIDPPNLSPALLQTQSALENFSRDPKLAKASLLNSARCPQFPDSEWTNLLAGRAIDLDHVLSGQYSVDHNERRSERFGRFELVVGSTTPAKTVKTHGEWVIAWTQAVEATLFVFPHRTVELQDYGKHILQLFASFPAHLHQRIIQYDRAVRLRAAQRRDLLLNEYNRYTDLQVLWIQNPAGPSRSQQDRVGGVRRRDACKRWNDGRCPNNPGSCNYAHVCLRCRSNAHTASACTTQLK